MKLSDKAVGRDNNFDAIRLAAAAIVLVHHTFKLSGSEFDPFSLVSRYDTTGGLGVSIFFIISGFLIAKSWQEQPSLFEYFKKRALRILPALAASTLLCVFVIGPLVTSLSLDEYFLHPWTRQYLMNAFLYAMYYNLPGVFAGNPLPDAVNGSLWTLTVEFYCYCLIAVLGISGIISRRRIFLLVTLVASALYLILLWSPEYFNKAVGYMIAGWASRCLLFFLAGSTLYVYGKRIPFDGRLALGLLLAYIISWPLRYGQYVCFFTLPYLVLYLAYSRIPNLNNLSGRLGDFSYGVYVYAFPVQQTVVYFAGNGLNRFAFFAWSFMITLALSVISWHFIEKPALRLKKVPAAIFTNGLSRLFFKAESDKAD